ncbi:MAG: pilus assembly protein TadG-related protein [Actinomycetota bacterium]|nr:pilus assembly protein TadG-related protein [Actinomycetota bacterium]
MKKLFFRRRDERGAMLALAAGSLVVMMISAALAIDLGRLGHEKRVDQRIADLAALDGARHLPDANAVKTAVEQSATRNEFTWTTSTFSEEGSDLNTCLGTLTGGSWAPGPNCTVGTAVRVQVNSSFGTAFPFVTGPDGVLAKAIGSLSTPLGTVRVGSNLVSLNVTQQTLLNRLLTDVIGGTNTVNLSAAGWNGIAGGNVSFSRLRTALGYSAGSTDGVLNSSITYRQLLDATISALNADGSPSSVAAATPLAAIASEVSATFGTAMKLGDLYEIVGNAGNGEDVADASFRVMDILQGGAILADTNHLASGTLFASDSIPSLGLIPNFYSAKLTFGLIEAPQMKTGSPGKDPSSNYFTTATTSQLRARLDLTLRLDLLGIGLTNVTVPYYIHAGQASASLDSMTCTSASEPTAVNIWGSTQQGSSSLGFVADANLAASAPPTPVVGPPILSVAGLVTASINNTVTATIPGNAGQMKTFSPPYTAASPSQQVPGTPITLPALQTSNLTVTATLLTLNTTVIRDTIVSGFTQAVGPTATNILNPVYGALGLSFGSADVWAPPVQDCSPQSYYNPNAPSNPYGVPTLAQ